MLGIRNNQSGFSIVEAMLAAALLLILTVGLISGLFYGVDGTVTAGKRTQAYQLAQEGIEAVRNIKEENYAAFSATPDGNYGLAQIGNKWQFDSTFDTTDGYTRIVMLTTEGATRVVKIQVTWSQNLQRSGEISLDTAFTNWMGNVATVSDGLVIYGDGSTTPLYRDYTTSSNNFSAEASTVAGDSGHSFILRTSPTKKEAIGGYVTSTGEIRILCYNGTAWTNEWTATVGGNGSTRPFDIAYETNSGNVMVMYSGNVSGTNELKYRKKSGGSDCGTANWSNQTNFDPVRTSGTVQWVKMAWDRRSSSNLISALWADSNSDLSVAVWNGTTFVNEPVNTTETSLEIVSIAQDVEDFDIEYESLSGDVMLVWANSAGSNGNNGVRYRTCNNGTSACVWSAVTTPPTFADDATNLDISANPDNNEIIFGSIGNAGGDMQIGHWSGSSWTNQDNVDTTSEPPVAGTKLISTGWLINGSVTRSIIAYHDNNTTNIGWYSCNGTNCTKESDFIPQPAFVNPQRYYDIQMDPKNPRYLMFMLSDNVNKLYAERLEMDNQAIPNFVWTNADANTTIENNLSQSINSPYSFSYWRF